MLVAGLFIFSILGAIMILIPSTLHLPEDVGLMADVIGIAMMMFPYIVLVYRLLQTTAYYLVESPKPGQSYAQLIYKDGTSYFIPAVRMPNGWIRTIFGLFKDMTPHPLRFPGGHVVYPVKPDIIGTIDPKIAEYSARIRKKYRLHNMNEAYLFARKVYEEMKKNNMNDLTDEELMKIRENMGKSPEDKEILKMSKKELRAEMEACPIPPGVLKEEFAGETYDFFQLQEYVLDLGSSKDFETIVKAERLSERLGKKEISAFSISPAAAKAFVWLFILIGIGVLVFFILKGGILQKILGGM